MPSHIVSIAANFGAIARSIDSSLGPDQKQMGALWSVGIVKFSCVFGSSWFVL
jgi:hypothetical protein